LGKHNGCAGEFFGRKLGLVAIHAATPDVKGMRWLGADGWLPLKPGMGVDLLLELTGFVL
jgi:hypothetical protein